MQGCAQCGKPFPPGPNSVDLCSECAAKALAELSLEAQVRRGWTRWREPILRLPLVTLLFLLINIAIYAESAYYARHGGVNQYSPLALRLWMENASAIHGAWWQLITCTFLQITFLHLASNAYLLGIFGWMGEPIFGRLNFLILWLFTGVAGSLDVIFKTPPGEIEYGASGVVYGLAGALLSLYIFGRTPAPRSQRILRLILLAALISLKFWLEWRFGGRVHPAHEGGFAAGLLFGVALPTAARPNYWRLFAVTATAVMAFIVCATIVKQKQTDWLELQNIDPYSLGLVRWDQIPKLERIVARWPHLTRARFVLAEAYQSGKRPDDAIRELKRVVAVEPRFVPGWYQLGCNLLKTDRHSEAMDAFSNYLQLISGNSTRELSKKSRDVVSISRGLMGTYDCTDSIDNAMRRSRAVLQANPNDRTAKDELQELDQVRNHPAP
jgi:rhomboid protease GluP